MKNNKNIRRVISKILLALFIIVVLIGILSNPMLSLNSATSGLSLWFNIVIPSLLPFFIISELLIDLGFVNLIGRLLHPIMKPLFNVPGEGAFPLAMSILSGYPVGSKITSRLREKNLITKEEGTRLICFTSTSGPLFMLGAVSIGMLKDPSLAPMIIIPHYLSILILGFIFRFYKPNKTRKNHTLKNHTKNNIFEEMQDFFSTWIRTNKSLGSMITKSVKESMDTILLIGGLLIFYSVLIEVLLNFSFINSILIHLINRFSLNINIIKGLISGFFEVTTGCKNIALTNINLISKILIINFLIGWGGVSVHSQAISFINNTDINSKLYIISKFFHGILSSLFGYIIYILKYKNYTQTTFLETIYIPKQFVLNDWIYVLTNSTKLVLSINLYVFILSIFIFLLHRKFGKELS
ncbi:sporulation integral membrane protein YlbJ [Tissierella sp.]|uniref:sporulation integral membrane protein YlbJ n=1 Tax=Tissierella sp. TaxID=41274 RepID=UPI002858D0DC|nr:sporulation integral membrane protein YlbJ [Tissierella sp.]MDR7856372.1 sporulation integral membrane protein YlbJ [Tissierella sp.]